MSEINLEEIQKIEFEILKTFASFCEKNKLQYSLAGGTLIGAIRHKGFIPWDDDIDVVMPRPDYDELIKKYKEFPEPYSIAFPGETSNKDEPYIYTYTKIFDLRTVLIEFPNTKKIKSHVYIDIFPVDGQPSDLYRLRKRFYKARRMINYNYNYKISYYSSKMLLNYFEKICWKAINILRLMFGENLYQKKLERICKSYRYQDCEVIGTLIAGYGINECIPKNSFFPQIEVEFEGQKFKAMNGYDLYLSNIYGDYLRLPPLEEQTKRHDFIAEYK